MNRKALIVVGVLLVAFFFFGAPAVKRAIVNLKVVGDNPSEDDRGVIVTAPAALLASVNLALAKTGSQARIDLNVYALARALRSEHGGEPASVRAWVAWAIRNGAQQSKVSVFEKLTRSRSPSTSGLFARQRSDARFAATNRGPTVEDVTIARAVMAAAQSADPTRGSTNFFSPKAQNALFARAQAGDPAIAGRITRDADDQRKKWLADGLISRGAPPGASRDDVEFFAKAVA
jgi:hypothetical protein